MMTAGTISLCFTTEFQGAKIKSYKNKEFSA